MVAESLNVFSSQRPIRIVDFYDHIFDKFQLTDIEKIFKIHFLNIVYPQFLWVLLWILPWCPIKCPQYLANTRHILFVDKTVGDLPGSLTCQRSLRWSELLWLPKTGQITPLYCLRDEGWTKLLHLVWIHDVFVTWRLKTQNVLASFDVSWRLDAVIIGYGCIL